MSEYKSMDDIKEAVEAEGGILTMPVGGLRDAYGAGRLGKIVRENISKALHGLGLGHYPLELPDWQEHPVRLYKLGTPASDLIDAVLNPSPTHDEEIRQAIRGEAADILKSVRELVCQ